jgi:hypothetical protein
MEKDDWLWPLRGGTWKERLLALADLLELLLLGFGALFLKHISRRNSHGCKRFDAPVGGKRENQDRGAGRDENFPGR